MTDDLRRNLTNPARLAAFAEKARQAAAADLRAERPDITDEEIAAILEMAGSPTVVWSSGRIRRKGTRTAIATDSGTATTAEALGSLRRTLPGSANRGGRTPGTNAVDDAGGEETIRALVSELRRAPRRVTAANVAASSGAFTADNLRYWLGVHGKRLRDY